MKSITRWLAALVVGGVGFVGLVAAGMAAGIGLAAGAVVALGTWLLLPREPWKKEVAEGVTRESLDRGKRDLRAAAMRFENLARRIRRQRPEGSEVLKRTGGRVRDLTRHLDRDASNLRRAEPFLEQHLPAALRVVERFAELAAQGDDSERGREELAATEETLAKIEALVEAQHGVLASDDLTELAVDRRVFEELLELDPELGRETRLARHERELE